MRVTEKSTGVNGVLPSEARRADSRGSGVGFFERRQLPIPTSKAVLGALSSPSRGQSCGCSTSSLRSLVAYTATLLGVNSCTGGGLEIT